MVNVELKFYKYNICSYMDDVLLSYILASASHVRQDKLWLGLIYTLWKYLWEKETKSANFLLS